MYWRTKKATYARALIDAMLSALSTMPGAALLATPKVVLFVTGPAISPDFDPSTYTAPTFHGYSADTITLSGTVNIGGTDQAVLASALFRATAGGTINDTCTGYMLVDTTMAVPYLIELFDNPMSFGAVGDFLQIDLVLPLPMIFTPAFG